MSATCDYKVRDMDGPQRRCGRRATKAAHTAARVLFYYCETCAGNAQAECRRTGTRLNLIEVQS